MDFLQLPIFICSLNYPLYRDGDAKDVDIKFLEKHQIVKGVEL